ncbi:MAG TPA: 6-phosphogluconolactonase [Gammaproteobacteria bacterium]|nr:6-phosphogluconolactonase [Gammaproteobacteria bacterium]
MKLKQHILVDADAAARQGAEFIAKLARQAVDQRGRFVLAVSGGQTPTRMFEILATENLPWAKIYLIQVDERVAPSGDADRNLTALQESLLAHVPLASQQFYPMPVEAKDLSAAAQHYAELLRRLGGSPSVFDLIHLGLGTDGHTASLVPGDPVLDVMDMDVAVTTVFQNRRRMTLTYPLINRSRHILWLVTGDAKAQVLSRLYAGDTDIPAGRVNREYAVVFADQAAGRLLS